MLLSVRELSRFRVEGKDGKLGKAADLYVEDATWSTRYLVVNTGRWPSAHRVLVPPEHLGQPDNAKRVLTLSLTREDFERFADSDSHQLISEQQALLLESRYGCAVYGGGGGPVGAVHGVVSPQALTIAAAEEATPALNYETLSRASAIISRLSTARSATSRICFWTTTTGSCATW